MRFVEGGSATVGFLLTAILTTLAGPPDAVRGEESPAAGEREEVLAAVQGFFDTMEARDVEGARRLVVPEGRFFSVRVEEGRPVVRSFTNEEYLGRLAERKAEVRERMWDPEVRIRGSIATVWAPYDFRIEGELSHCGVDAFDLIRTDEGWKIAGGVYTVEKECEGFVPAGEDALEGGER